MGRVANVSALGEKLYNKKPSAKELAALAFLGTISPNLTIVDENDKYRQSIGISDYGDEKTIRKKVDEIVSIIKANKAPMTIDELDNKLDYEHPDHIKAVASISKLLATLNGLWGLTKWPTVNPKKK